MSIDIGRAFGYVVEQPQWLPRLLVVAGVAFVASSGTLVPLGALALAALPMDTLGEYIEIPTWAARQEFSATLFAWTVPSLVIGLVATALLLGYFLEVVRRVRHSKQAQLPGLSLAMVSDGAGMLGAYLVYIVGNIALGAGLIAAAVLSLQDTVLPLLISVYCCALPLTLLYSLLMIFVTSLAVVFYSESHNMADFFAWGRLWRLVNTHRGLTARWFGFSTLANLGLGAVQNVPVVGILLNLTLSVPVLAHLMGQYAAILDASEVDSQS